MGTISISSCLHVGSFGVVVDSSLNRISPKEQTMNYRSGNQTDIIPGYNTPRLFGNINSQAMVDKVDEMIDCGQSILTISSIIPKESVQFANSGAI